MLRLKYYNFMNIHRNVKTYYNFMNIHNNVLYKFTKRHFLEEL